MDHCRAAHPAGGMRKKRRGDVGDAGTATPGSGDDDHNDIDDINDDFDHHRREIEERFATRFTIGFDPATPDATAVIYYTDGDHGLYIV